MKTRLNARPSWRAFFLPLVLLLGLAAPQVRVLAQANGPTQQQRHVPTEAALSSNATVLPAWVLCAAADTKAVYIGTPAGVNSFVGKPVPGPTGPQGPAGTPGANGSNGTNGTAWFFGSSAPLSALGTNGDYYYNTATGDVSNKTSGSWSVIGNIKGATGVQGVQGSPGQTGATGATGPAGTNGTSPTVTVNSTTTLAAGSSATVTNSGTSTNILLNFGIPQGVAGTVGATGATGATGPAGPNWPIKSGASTLTAAPTSLIFSTGLTATASGNDVTVTAPTSLPPNGSASGDLSGTYPSPTLVASGVTAAAYPFGSSFTVDSKGRVTAATSPTGTASSTTYLRGDGTWATPAGGAGSGTVTSVGLSMPSVFTVTSSPVTSSGTLTAAFASQSANQALMSPNGSAGPLTVRALVGADLVPLTLTSPSTTTVPLSVVAASGQTSSLLNLSTSTGTGDLLSFTPTLLTVGASSAFSKSVAVNGAPSFHNSSNLSIRANGSTQSGCEVYQVATGNLLYGYTQRDASNALTFFTTAAGVVQAAGYQSSDGTAGTTGSRTDLTVKNGLITGLGALSASTLGAEPALGNPSTNGYVLSSTAAGVRSWIVPSSGGSGGTSFTPQPSVSPSNISLAVNSSSRPNVVTAAPSYGIAFNAPGTASNANGTYFYVGRDANGNQVYYNSYDYLYYYPVSGLGYWYVGTTPGSTSGVLFQKPASTYVEGPAGSYANAGGLFIQQLSAVMPNGARHEWQVKVANQGGYTVTGSSTAAVNGIYLYGGTDSNGNQYFYNGTGIYLSISFDTDAGTPNGAIFGTAVGLDTANGYSPVYTVYAQNTSITTGTATSYAAAGWGSISVAVTTTPSFLGPDHTTSSYWSGDQLVSGQNGVPDLSAATGALTFQVRSRADYPSGGTVSTPSAWIQSSPVTYSPPPAFLGGQLFALTTPATISAASTTKQTFSYAPSGGNVIAANTLQPGETITLRGQFADTTSASPPTLTPQIDFTWSGGSASVIGSAVTAIASGTSKYADCDLVGTVLTTGTSGTIRWDGAFGYTATGGYTKIGITSTVTTVNTTAAITVAPAGTYSAATSGNSRAVNQFSARLN